MATIVNEKETHEEKPLGETEKVKPMEFLRGVKGEFTKITWPSREQVTTELISVILLVALLTGIIFLIDKVFEFVSNFFIRGIY